MIRGFRAVSLASPEISGRLQWGPAWGAGFIAGIILLIIPRGSPWSALTFFSPAIMGRSLAPVFEMPLMLAWLIHLCISLFYGVIISAIVSGITQTRAVLIGGAVGLVLYLLNLLVVSLFWPQIRGNEIPVVFTHFVFGLVAAAMYRGLLRRGAVRESPTSS